MLHHHAQLVEGNERKFLSLLNQLETQLGLGKSHPDLRTFSFANEKLGIDDAHVIRDALLRNPVAGPHMVVAVYAHTLTEQAQNALLKICEEPPQTSHIFIVTQFLPHIIPTLRSRFVLNEDIADMEFATDIASHAEAGAAKGPKKTPVRVSAKTKTGATTGARAGKSEIFSVQEFISQPLDARLNTVKEIHSALDKETVNIGQVWDFVNAIEKDLHERIATDQASEEAKDALEVINRAQSFMHAPGNSIKMLLEYVAIRV